MKKKHIVVLVGSYYPNFSAVGVCAKNVVDELKKEAMVTVLSQKTDINEKKEEKYDGYHLRRVVSRLDNIRLYALNKQKSKSKLIVTSSLVVINFIRIVYYLQAILSNVNIKGGQVKAFINAMLSIDKQNNIDAIVCCSFPFESTLAGIWYKELYNNEVKVIPYFFDNFVERDGLHRTLWNKKIKWKKHVKLVESVLQRSTQVIAMHSLKKHFDTYYSENLEKILYMEHPLLVSPQMIPINQFKETIDLVYAGSFLKNYVEPYFMINVLKEIINDKNIHIHFYVMGNCTNCIAEFASLYPNQVSNHGKVPFARANNAILNSSILLSVSENSGIQMSSKIFTYMSAGKPIIQFYNNESDINKEILSKYPLFLAVKQNSVIHSEAVKRISDFIYANRSKILDFKAVSSLYLDAEPIFTMKKIIDIVNDTSY